MAVFLLGGLLGCEDSDGIYKKISLTASDISPNEGDGVGTIEIQLNTFNDQETPFVWFTQDGTARGGGSGERDFTAVSKGRGSIPASTKGATERAKATLEVQINEDVLDENDEFFYVVIIPESSSTSGGDRDHIVETRIAVNIVDNDDPPHLILDDMVVDEGGESATIHYALSTISGRETGFVWRTADGSARNGERDAGGDYLAISPKRISVPAGALEGSLNITVPIHDDLQDEVDENFKVVIPEDSLSGLMPSGSKLQAVVAITDNDDPPTLTVHNFQMAEGGEATVQYHLSPESGRETSFRWSTRDGSAKSREGDYTTVDDRLEVIPPGTPSGVLTISLGDDLSDESNESFQVAVPRGFPLPYFKSRQHP